MNLGLKGKTAVITGGNSGIGVGLSLRFAEEGCNVVIVGRDMAKSREVADRAVKAGGTAVALYADLTDRASVQEMVTDVVRQFGDISILVNNVGGPLAIKPFLDLRDDELQAEMALNVWGAVYCTQTIGKIMSAAGRGSIVNISSTSSVVPKSGFGMVNYAGTKGYINSFTRALAYELAPAGIRVNTITPGWIIPYSKDDVSKGSNWRRFAFDFFGEPDQARERIGSGEDSYAGDELLIKRAGSPDDIAYAALYFASEVSSYCTGQTISVSGGHYMTS